MRSDYAGWLRAMGYDEGTVTAQLHRVGRVEQFHGDLERRHAEGRMATLVEELTYSTEDERRGRANPSRIPINRTLRTNLASYRHAVLLYQKFLAGEEIEKRPSELRSRRRPTAMPSEDACTLAEFGFDGHAALAALIAASRYKTLDQAVASLAAFSHPETVAQTGGRAIFPTVRGTPGQFGEVNGRAVMFDDNRSPTDAFLWANGLSRRGRDIQFNHIYAASGDVDAYTALPNVVMTPAFIAKLTDTSPEIRALLAWRSFDLYGWLPTGRPAPARPDNYATLKWAPPLPAVMDVQAEIERRMSRRLKDRTVAAARRLGWLFGRAA